MAYKQHRPPEMMADDSLFYLAVNTEVPTAGKKWFKAAPLGVNSLRSMVTNMLAASQVHSDKKLVNHSTRKHLVQKLVDNNIAPNEIEQITGHKNINSLDNYSAISDRRQQHTSTVLSRRGESSTSVASPKVTVDEITSLSFYSSTQHKCRNFALSLPVPGRNSEHFHKFAESKRQRF